MLPLPSAFPGWGLWSIGFLPALWVQQRNVCIFCPVLTSLATWSQSWFLSCQVLGPTKQNIFSLKLSLQTCNHQLHADWLEIAVQAGVGQMILSPSDSISVRGRGLPPGWHRRWEFCVSEAPRSCHERQLRTRMVAAPVTPDRKGEMEFEETCAFKNYSRRGKASDPSEAQVRKAPGSGNFRETQFSPSAEAGQPELGVCVW